MPPDGLTGGEKLAAHLAKIAKGAASLEVRTGFLAGGTEPDGASLPMVAAINEFGAPSRGQPPRPFFRRMIAKHKGEWAGELGKVLAANDYDATKALDLMGQRIKGELQQSIVDLIEPALAPSTIRRKGSAKPLIDSGTMLAGVDYEVGPAAT